MGDNLFILLQSKLDAKKSIDTINKQILEIGAKLNHLDIKLNIDNKVLTDLNNKINQAIMTTERGN